MEHKEALIAQSGSVTSFPCILATHLNTQAATLSWDIAKLFKAFWLSIYAVSNSCFMFCVYNTFYEAADLHKH